MLKIIEIVIILFNVCTEQIICKLINQETNK